MHRTKVVPITMIRILFFAVKEDQPCYILQAEHMRWYFITWRILHRQVVLFSWHYIGDGRNAVIQFSWPVKMSRSELVTYDASRCFCISRNSSHLYEIICLPGIFILVRDRYFHYFAGTFTWQRTCFTRDTISGRITVNTRGRHYDSHSADLYCCQLGTHSGWCSQ